MRFLASLLIPIMFYAPMTGLAAKHWLVGADAPLSLLTAVQAAIASVQPRVMAERLRAVLACDVRGAVGEIAVPTLYIRAEQDRLVGVSCGEELERINPQIVLAPLSGPHLILQREPRMAAETVLAFVRSRCTS